MVYVTHDQVEAMTSSSIEETTDGIAETEGRER